MSKILLLLLVTLSSFCSTEDIDLESQKQRIIVGYKNRSIDIQTDDHESPEQIHKFYRTETRLVCMGGFALGMTLTSVFLTTVWYNKWLEFDL